MSIPKILHFVTQPEPSASQKSVIERARALHPDWELKHWKDSDQIGELSVYSSKCNSGAQRADLIRVDAVTKFGGVYLDSDMELHKPLDLLAETYDCFMCTEDGKVPTNAGFGAAAGHPVIKSIGKHLLLNEPDWELPPHLTTGPWLWRRLLRYEPDITMLPREAFYPYAGFDRVKEVHRVSIAEHRWDASWRKPSGRRSDRAVHKDRLAPTDLKGKLEAFAQRSARRAGILSNKLTPAARRPCSYSRNDSLVVSTRHGHSLVLSQEDLSITPRIAADGAFELAEELYVRRALSGGDWFIDVGANFGVYSMLAAAQVGPFGRVHAFEPNPFCHSFLKDSAMANWYHDRFRLVGAAVSDAPGQFDLVFNPARVGDGHLDVETVSSAQALTEQVVGASQTVSVEAVRLDDVFPADLPIKMLKIDVEGHEAAVLKGASRLIDAGVFDHIMVEAEYHSAESWAALLEQLRRLETAGYAPGSADRYGRFVAAASVDALIGAGETQNLIFQFSGR